MVMVVVCAVVPDELTLAGDKFAVVGHVCAGAVNDAVGGATQAFEGGSIVKFPVASQPVVALMKCMAKTVGTS